MHRWLSGLILPLMFSVSAYGEVERPVELAAALGYSQISNIGGYSDAKYGRLEGSYYFSEYIGAGLFVSNNKDFRTTSGEPASISIAGKGASMMARLPVNANFQTYGRLDYMFWNAEVTALGRVSGQENGHSLGWAMGLIWLASPDWKARAELSGYNKVSDANLSQFSIGVIFPL